jgi:hypothetical protein
VGPDLVDEFDATGLATVLQALLDRIDLGLNQGTKIVDPLINLEGCVKATLVSLWGVHDPEVGSDKSGKINTELSGKDPAPTAASRCHRSDWTLASALWGVKAGRGSMRRCS